MSLLRLIPGVRKSDAGISFNAGSIKGVAEKVLRRDDYTCRFCGFRSLKYQHIVPHKEGGNPPFVTACTFCEQYLCMEQAGKTGSGLLIWLPEIDQIDLNHIARAAYVARSQKDSPVASLATRTIDALTARRAEAKKRLGSDDPLLLATVLYESLDDVAPEEISQKLDGIRLLPSDKYWVRGASGDVNQFSSMAKFWQSSEGPYGKWPTTKWPELFKSAMSSAGHA